MRLTRPILLGLSLLLIPVLVWVGVASAQEFRSGDTTTVSSGETVDSTLWIAGRNIDIAGEVQGDVFCAGQTVAISGTVTGDIICAAQTIHISGNVDGDIRAAAQTISISSEITGSMTIAAQTATVESQANIAGDASFAVQDVILHGTVSRDLSLASQTATIAGNVGRDITASVDRLRLTSDAEVGGEIAYTSVRDADIADEAQVGGEVARTEPEVRETTGANIGFNLFGAFVLLVTAFVLVLLLPRLFHLASDHAVVSPLKTFLVGFVATIVMPVLIIGIMITILGIPLGLIVLTAWILIIGLSGAFAAYYLGRLVWRDQANPILIMVAGAAILLALRFIPIVGLLATALAIWFGVGMILLELRRRFATPAYDVNELKK